MKPIKLWILATTMALFAWAPPALAAPAPAQATGDLNQDNKPCSLEVEVTDTIGPATVDLLNRVLRHADQKNCKSVLLLVNTPGGSLESTRKIVESILSSPIPFLCLVSPSGGHAGSAGAIILQACHVNGALKGTNLGAATPIALGQEMPTDLRQKIVNDTRSWLESLTRLRGRSEKFGQDIILEAKAVTAEEALKLKAIDFVGATKDEFVSFAQGREVQTAQETKQTIHIGEVQSYALDLRFKILSLLLDPEFAYLLLMVSLGLLYFEITHTGIVLPGVLGGIGLVFALMALHKLEVEWGGVALIMLGVGLTIAEMFVPSFGALGIGGVAALLLGSVFLFDPARSGGYRLPLQVIAPVVIIFALVVLGISYLALKTLRVRKKGGFEDMMGVHGVVVRVDSAHEGMVELRGELWKFTAHSEVNLNDKVIVTGHRGLVLHVRKES